MLELIIRPIMPYHTNVPLPNLDSMVKDLTATTYNLISYAHMQLKLCKQVVKIDL